jgi:hypothetical protein
MMLKDTTMHLSPQLFTLSYRRITAFFRRKNIFLCIVAPFQQLLYLCRMEKEKKYTLMVSKDVRDWLFSLQEVILEGRLYNQMATIDTVLRHVMKQTAGTGAKTQNDE